MIYAVCLNCWNSFSRYRAIVVEGRKKKERKKKERRKKEESQKIDDLPVLATSRSVTSAMLSNEFNAPNDHGGTL